MRTKTLGTVVIDLTPIGPENNDSVANQFIFNLIKNLAQLAPQTFFILLTQGLFHEELLTLEEMNISCKQIRVYPKNKWDPIPPLLFKLHNVRYAKRLVPKLYSFLYELPLKYQRTSLLKSLKADLLFCPFTAPTFATAKIPTISVLHDLRFKTHPHFFSKRELLQHEHHFTQACKKAHALVTLSDHSRQSVLQECLKYPKQIQTIYAQTTPSHKPPTSGDQSILKKLQLTPANYVIYPADFQKHRNHDRLITAFQQFIQHSHSPIKLVCTGASGEHQRSLIQTVSTLGLADTVIFPGFLCADHQQSLLSSASGIIFPSLYEGSGLSLIEAMRAGVPVACSNMSSLPEITGTAALLFNPTQVNDITTALQTLIYDQEQRATLVELGYRRAEEFSDAQQMAKQYWDLFVAVTTRLS